MDSCGKAWARSSASSDGREWSEAHLSARDDDSHTAVGTDRLDLSLLQLVLELLDLEADLLRLFDCTSNARAGGVSTRPRKTRRGGKSGAALTRLHHVEPTASLPFLAAAAKEHARVHRAWRHAEQRQRLAARGEREGEGETCRLHL